MSYASYPISEVSLDNPAYPYLLAQIGKPPQSLFFKGNLSAVSNLTLSIVGSRSMTPYGMRVLNMLVPGLVESGLTIVSGLAYGIDSHAHSCALRHNGTCVAVFGTGLEKVYPSSNQSLAAHILNNNGCILSEYPVGTAAKRYHFPERNRIVAGLSMATLIVEAGEKSGTLITAREALDSGRQVAVVPADITRESSIGTHMLLKQGAQPVTSVQDVLDLYDLKLPLYGGTHSRADSALTGIQATLYDSISREPLSTGALIEQSKLSVQDVQRTLSSLELQGLIFFKERAWHPTS